MADYRVKNQKLQSRRFDTDSRTFSLSESYYKKAYGESTTYALESMLPISRTYTENTYKACERIQNQLKPGLKEYDIDVSFQYQGSVPADIHIKLYSDIDMLTLHERFYSLQPPQVVPNPYKGNPLDDLQELRKKTYRILDTVYPACKIDDTSSKCLTISGGSLNRTIDIIPSNWYNALIYANNPTPNNRGIMILDRDKNERIINFPFLHIYWIDEKDRRVNGNERRMIRLLKSLKADADEEIKVSSYDIASLIYRMEDHGLQVGHNRLKLLQNTNEYLLKVINDNSFREGLYVANGTRKIFCDEGAKATEVAKLQRELQELIVEIAREIRPLNETIDRSSIYYA